MSLSPPLMPTRVTEDAPNAGDDLDAIFGYEINENDAVAMAAQVPRATNGTNNSSTANTAGIAVTGNLGLNEEVKITKRREPTVKLDEERLLSEAGIPRLRTLMNDRLRLKGKGHEFDDVERMIGVYQLWMDDLYPRAKFADGLAIIEKLGHSKRMREVRRTWTYEKRDRERRAVEAEEAEREREREGAAGDEEGERDPFASLGNAERRTEGVDAEDSDDSDGSELFVPDSNNDKAAGSRSLFGGAMDDDLDALLDDEFGKDQQTTAAASSGAAAPLAKDGDGDVPMNDELDDILAEPDHHVSARKPAASQQHDGGSYEEENADDIEAMRDMW